MEDINDNLHRLYSVWIGDDALRWSTRKSLNEASWAYWFAGVWVEATNEPLLGYQSQKLEASAYCSGWRLPLDSFALIIVLNFPFNFSWHHVWTWGNVLLRRSPRWLSFERPKWGFVNPFVKCLSRRVNTILRLTVYLIRNYHLYFTCFAPLGF